MLHVVSDFHLIYAQTSITTTNLIAHALSAIVITIQQITVTHATTTTILTRTILKLDMEIILMVDITTAMAVPK